jgi:hypothetical protein
MREILGKAEALGTCFPEELRDDALPYFLDCFLENVHLVEISAHSDDDAYIAK